MDYRLQTVTGYRDEKNMELETENIYLKRQRNESWTKTTYCHYS